jgi:hypothetical protein
MSDCAPAVCFGGIEQILDFKISIESTHTHHAIKQVCDRQKNERCVVEWG